MRRPTAVAGSERARSEGLVGDELWTSGRIRDSGAWGGSGEVVGRGVLGLFFESNLEAKFAQRPETVVHGHPRNIHTSDSDTLPGNCRQAKHVSRKVG